MNFIHFKRTKYFCHQLKFKMLSIWGYAVYCSITKPSSWKTLCILWLLLLIILELYKYPMWHTKGTWEIPVQYDSWWRSRFWTKGRCAAAKVEWKSYSFRVNQKVCFSGSPALIFQTNTNSTLYCFSPCNSEFCKQCYKILIYSISFYSLYRKIWQT